MTLPERLIGYVRQVAPDLFYWELAAAFLILLLAWLAGRNRMLAGAFQRLSNRQWIACAAVTLFVLGTRVALLPILPIPDPMIRDEFSHLLGADTYSLGRLANPPHPQWVHFEAPYTIQRPTFVSAYPPGQALPMAAAKALGIQPWWAVWLTTGLMCGAVCWALQGWLPSHWALFVALVAALRYGILSYWMNSYWGASVPALGGALAIGALPRLRNGSTSVAVCFAAGLSITIVARPYEGLVLAASLATAGAFWLWNERRFGFAGIRDVVMTRKTVAAVLVLAASGCWMLYYCRRTTGAFELPYNIFIREYWAARHFIPMDLPPKPNYRHDVFNAMGAVFRTEHQEARSVKGFIERNVARALFWWPFYCGPLLMLPLLFGFRAFADVRIRPLLFAALTFAVGLSIEVPKMPHYAAPFTAAWLVIWGTAAQYAAASRYGLGLVRLIPVALVSLVLYRVVHVATVPEAPLRVVRYNEVMNWCCVPRGISRADFERTLNNSGGRHLVFFRTPAGKMIQYEWVYNKPDIDSAGIVWARSMSAAQDAELCRYYPDRRAWIIEAEPEKPTIQPYCSGAESR